MSNDHTEATTSNRRQSAVPDHNRQAVRVQVLSMQSVPHSINNHEGAKDNESPEEEGAEASIERRAVERRHANRLQILRAD